MAERMRLAGRTAVVTGAAGGIGRGIAVALSRRGCHLALADVNEAGAAETASLVGSSAVRVSVHRLDVADREAVARFPTEVIALHGGVDLLFNNAGVALGGRVEEVSDADFEWLFEVNFWGVVRMTRAFLPWLERSDDARLVNMSSVFGLVAPRGNVPYAASKFAVRGFTEGLRQELDHTTVGVTVVHPGGVATRIADDARPPAGATEEEIARRRAAMKRMLRMPASRAGELIVRGVERRKARILVGWDAVALSLLARVMPASYDRVLTRGLRR